MLNRFLEEGFIIVAEFHFDGQHVYGELIFPEKVPVQLQAHSVFFGGEYDFVPAVESVEAAHHIVQLIFLKKVVVFEFQGLRRPYRGTQVFEQVISVGNSAHKQNIGIQIQRPFEVWPEEVVGSAVAISGKKHFLPGERINFLDHLVAIGQGEIGRAFGHNNQICPSVIVSTFTEPAGGKQPIACERAGVLCEQDIESGGYGQVLKGIIQQYALGLRIAFNEFRHAQGSAFADADGHFRKFSFELQGFIAHHFGGIDHGKLLEAGGIAAIASAQHSYFQVLVEPAEQVFDVRRFSGAANGKITYRNNGEIEVYAAQNTYPIKKVAHTHADAVQQCQRQQENTDYYIVRHGEETAAKRFGCKTGKKLGNTGGRGNEKSRPERIGTALVWCGTSQDRTGDTWIFSPLLYHLS